MSEYQIVPYNFSVYVAGKPGERRNLDDLDAAGLGVTELVARATHAHLGSARLKDPGDTTSLQIEQVALSDRVAVVTAGSGQRGVSAEVIQSRAGTTTKTKILEEDWTHTPLRNVFFAPPHSTVGVALIERVGRAGVVTKLQEMIRESLKARSPDLSFSMVPAMSPEAIERWGKDAQVKSIVLRHTHTTTGESTAKLGGLSYGQAIVFKAPRKQSWTSALFGGKLNKAAQLKILSEVVPQMPGLGIDDAEATALKMMEEGWVVSLGMKKGGRERLVKVSTTASITMTFPASLATTGGKRPTHGEFEEACQAALEEMASDGMSVGQPKLCSWDDKSWDNPDQAWKAVWGVPESSTTSSTP